MQSFGEPEQVQVMQGGAAPDAIPQLHVAQFAPEGPTSPNVFATCGASLYEMEDGRRIEGIVICRREPTEEERQGILRLLGRFSLFPATQKAVFRPGDLIDAKEDLAAFCDMDSVLMLPPLPFVDTFRTVDSRHGAIEILWLVPIFNAEAEYARTHGIPALLNLVSAQGLDLSEPRRDEANTLMAPEEAASMALERAKEQAEKAKNAAPSPRSVAKLKTNRKNVGKGSFDVEEGAGGVKINRRAAPKPKVKAETPRTTAPAPAAPDPAPMASGGPSRGPAVPGFPGGSAANPPGGLARGGPPAGVRPVPGPPGAARPGGLPGRAGSGAPGAGGPARQPVRFDLSAAGVAPPPTSKPTLPARKKTEPPKVKTPEELEAERKARIEALKEAAREADERAKARTQGDPEAEGQ